MRGRSNNTTEMDEFCFTGGFQDRVLRWCINAFGVTVTEDKTERGDRFLEEALELLQAVGYDFDRIEAIINYVKARPVGAPRQEVGGVMVTLAALCNANDQIIMGLAANREMDRIEKPEVMSLIRQKQLGKRVIHEQPGNTASG